MLVGRARRPGGAAPAIRRLALAALLFLPAGCAWVGLPDAAMPGSGNEGMEALLRDRVWIDQSPEAAPGTLRAFLSDGTLVMTSCVETYRLAPWRWVSGARMVWEEDGQNIDAEVVVVSKESLGLTIALPDGTTETHGYKAAQSPVVCPDLPR
jgi:hypothetical protein